MSAQPDQATESMLQQMHESMLKACEGMVKIPADCFALIRLPISIPHFASFSRVCERMSPNCVTKQCGEFLMVMHSGEGDGDAKQDLVEALEYILADSVTFLRETAIEKAHTAIAKAKRGPQ